MVQQQNRCGLAPVPLASHRQLRPFKVDIGLGQALGQRLARGRCGHGLAGRVLGQQIHFVHRRRFKLTRHIGHPYAVWVKMTGQVHAVARSVAKAHRHFQIWHHAQGAVAKRGRIAHAVAIARLQQLDHATVQEIQIGHIGVGAVGIELFVPWPKHMLVAVAKPQPQHMRRVPLGNDGLQVRLEFAGRIGFGKHGKAIGQGHAAAIRVPGRKLDSDGRTGVPPIGGHLPNAQGRQGFGQGVRKIFHRRSIDGQGVGKAKAWGIERKTGVLLGEDVHQGPHHLG